jgi:hypothetical protein
MLLTPVTASMKVWCAVCASGRAEQHDHTPAGLQNFPILLWPYTLGFFYACFWTKLRGYF